MTEQNWTRVTATGEALKVNAHDQRWNMALLGPEGHTPEGLVALVFGYSPEGLARRTYRLAECWNAMVDVPDPAAYVAAMREVCEALEGANAALNSMADLVEAEWRDHDKAMSRHDADVRAYRQRVSTALAKARETQP